MKGKSERDRASGKEDWPEDWMAVCWKAAGMAVRKEKACIAIALAFGELGVDGREGKK